MSREEQETVNNLPATAIDLLQDIPRTEPVLEILRSLIRKPPSVGNEKRVAGEWKGPVGAEILRLADDFDILESRLGSAKNALMSLRERAAAYEPAVFRAFARTRADAIERMEAEGSTLASIRPGMILVDNVINKEGRLLLARGQEVTETLISRLRAFIDRGEIGDSVKASTPLLPIPAPALPR